MRLRQFFPALVVALAASAALGPPVAAKPGGGGGAFFAPPAQGVDNGGAGYGDPAPKRKRRVRARPLGSKGARHAFPIAGPFSWGSSGSRFGARRRGHRHQGQDLAADIGTPVVAPYAGTVEVVAYQARGAGHYVVLDGNREDYDYVFMHLRTGSTTVRPGEHVRLGQALGEVGSTGASSGPHLHFEVWVGGWFTGGRPIDPLALLAAWSGLSPASG